MKIKGLLIAAVAAGTFGLAAEASQAGYRHGYHGHHNPRHCGALIRAAGKRNLIRQFARNSAIFAWKREARYVYGYDYGYWREATARRIHCRPSGIFVRCVAKARPCADD